MRLRRRRLTHGYSYILIQNRDGTHLLITSDTPSDAHRLRDRTEQVMAVRSISRQKQRENVRIVVGIDGLSEVDQLYLAPCQ